MPVYSQSFDLANGDENIRIHVFDYMNENETDTETTETPKKGKGPKQLISLYSCMFLGTKNLTWLNDEHRDTVLKKGQVYEGYYIRTKNGTYDYCYKIWTNRRLPFPPLNYPTPKEDEVNDAIIIDRNKDYYGIACGPHLAFCRTKSLEAVGVSLKNISYPTGGIKARLRRINDNRPAEIPYAAFEAIPVVPEEEEEEEEEEEKEKENEE